MATLFEAVTQQIFAAIEAGVSDYRMPWNRHGVGGGQPVNAITRHAYRGINILLLLVAGQRQGYCSLRWATYRQWADAGAQVRKGERSTTVALWKHRRDPDSGGSDTEGESARSHAFARAFRVFNADQVDGASPTPLPPANSEERIAAAEQFFGAVGAAIRVGGDQACYVPSLDEIRIPPFAQFVGAKAYYSVLAHELVHWTGGKTRLDRDLAGRFGGESYAMEELIAELGAAFLSAELGLGTEPRRDHAPYIASWLKVLHSDPRAIFTAAGHAQRAVDFLIARAESLEDRSDAA